MGDLEEALKGQRLTCIKSRRYSDSMVGRSVRRPEDISRDVRGLKARRRVSLVLQDDILREDLEEMTKAYTRNGAVNSSIRTYQDFLIPTVQPSYNGGAGMSGFGGRVSPVNDLRGDMSLVYPKSERMARCKLASFYRVVDYFRWSYLVYNHLTVRVGGTEDKFLIKPLGLLDGEVTASSLISLDLEGNVVDFGSSGFDVNIAGFYIHSAVYETRPNAKCIAHIHYPSVQAVASMKCGLLRINQESLGLGKISYLDFGGLFVTPEEKEDLQKSFPADSKVLMMRNHGVLVVGESIEEAFQLLYGVVEACETQVRMMPAGLDNIYILGEDLLEEYAVSTNSQNMRMGDKCTMSSNQMEWEAMMRTLDGLGYCTGYAYRMPDLFSQPNGKKIPESQVPPTATSLTVQSRDKAPYDLIYEVERGSAVQRSASVSRANTYRNRVKWLNSPIMAAQYQKEKEAPPRPKMVQEEGKHTKTNEKTIAKPDASDVVDKEERVRPTPDANDATVVTQTQTSHTTTTDHSHVTSTTNVIKMVSHKTVEIVDGKEVVVDDSHVFVNGTSNGADDFVVVEGHDASLSKSPKRPEPGSTPESPAGASGLAAPGSENGSRSDLEDKLTEEGGKSGKKVKKQKSFKSFMKKVGKK